MISALVGLAVGLACGFAANVTVALVAVGAICMWLGFHHGRWSGEAASVEHTRTVTLAPIVKSSVEHAKKTWSNPRWWIP